ncbi:unnamed protein product [Owenia fusiformis]|uniref:5'-nucleotidase n=1 Tax=Owenia fusiformis TaxID=6347 RepID=A0A8S4P509_OWEFU|nr:unnamed protein product [Owenia fusiformis]
MNLLRYDAMVLGNHEFDNGPSPIANFLNLVNFPVISSNVNVTKDDQLRGRIPPSVEFEFGGDKVAIVGYTTIDTPSISKPGPTITFEDAYESIQKEVDAVKGRGVNKIIVLSHGGADVDMTLAKQLIGVDMIVGGHTHTFLYNGTSPTNEDQVEGPYPIVIDSEVQPGMKVLIVQDYMFGKYLGKITINFDDDGKIISFTGNPILLSSNVTKDPVVMKEITEKKEQFSAEMSKVIGTTRVMLDSQPCKKEECNFGNLITDAMVHKMLEYATESNGWTDAAIAIMNAGSIRIPISNTGGGEVSIEDIQRVLPFRNTIDVIGLNGTTLRKVIEHSLSFIGRPNFIQVAGMRIVASTQRPVGSRVLSIMVQCSDDCDTPVYEALKEDKVYKVAMSTFLADGGDGYTMIKEDKISHELQSNLDSSVVIDHISKMSPISAAVEARIATQVKEIRKSYKNVLLLDAGDQWQGTLWYTVFGESVIAEFMNLLGYDVMVLGNHEFDEGPTALANFVSLANFSIISANVNVTNDVQLRNKIAPSVEFEFEGERVAIVGYTTTDTPFIAKPGPTITFEDIYQSVQSEIGAVKRKGINKIIVLGHGGIHIDMDLAKKLTDVDLIVGGHTNTFLYTGDTPAEEDDIEGPYPLFVDSDAEPGRKIPIVHDYAYGKYLGKITLDFDADGNLVSYMGNPILLSSNVTKDPNVSAVVTQRKSAFDNETSRVIGSTRVMLDSISCKEGECSFGNLITDAMVRKMLEYSKGVDGWTDASIAIMNSGSIRVSISNEGGGPVTIGAVQHVLPFRNTIDIVGLKGTTLKDVMEHSVSLIGHPRFLQVAGLKIVADTSQPVGSRVVSILVRCAECDTPVYEPLDNDKVYKVAMSTFLAEGGDGYAMIRENKTLHEEQNNLDSSVVIEHFSKMSPIIVGIEGRITLQQSNTKFTTESDESTTISVTSRVTSPAPCDCDWCKRKERCEEDGWIFDDDDDCSRSSGGPLVSIVMTLIGLIITRISTWR